MMKPSQVKFQINHNEFCIEQRNRTVENKNFRCCGEAEAPLGFQAGWSDCKYLVFLTLFVSFAHLEFPFKFLNL
jgi:hypothetical protein